MKNRCSKQFPKHILLVHRKNFEWLNFPMVKFMQNRFNTFFTIITPENSIFKYKEILNSHSYIFNHDHLDDIIFIKQKIKKNKDIYKLARNYEKKYRITFLSDIIMQDRRYSIKYKGVKNSPWSSSNIFNIEYEDVLLKIVFYFEVFERYYKKNKIDCVISRPDDLIGASLVNISKAGDIFVTLQHVSRYFGYHYWSYGAYSDHHFIENFYKKNLNKKNNKESEVFKIGSSSGVRTKNLANEFKILNFIKILLFLTLDRVMFIYKDIIREKRSKNRITYASLVQRKFTAFLSNATYLKLAEKNIKNILDTPFIYFPLPEEIEYFTHSLARKFNDIYTIISQISYNLPTGYKLVIKEHLPNMGLKPKNYYENLKKKPNIIIADYKMDSKDLIVGCDAVVTTAGTVSIEAAINKKKSLLFANNVEYMHLNNIVKVENLTNLKKYVDIAIKPLNKKELSNLNKQVRAYKDFFHKKGFLNLSSPLNYGGDEKHIPEKNKKKFDSDKTTKKAVNELIEISNFFYNERKKRYDY